jgi:F-type H+-transporting ATPase subunit b
MPEINVGVFISQLITFLIALTVIWIFSWKPLLAFMKQRQQKIKESIENAEKMRETVAKLEEDYKSRVRQIELQSTEMINMARAESLRVRDEIVKNAQKEAADLRRKSEEQLEHSRAKIVREIRGEVVGLSMAIVKKVLGETAVGPEQSQRFEQVLEELTVGKEPHRAG